MSRSSDDPNPSLSPIQFLARLQAGQFLYDLRSNLQETVQGVIDTGKKGEITIKISVNPVDKAPNAVVFKADVKTVIPQITPATDLLFVGEEGTLHENNPRQRDIFGPRPVSSSVDIETGEILENRA